MTHPLPASIDATTALLEAGDYVADRSLATALYLALSLGRPLFLEGEAGVGKTEIAKVLSQALGRRLSTFAISVLPTPASPSRKRGRPRLKAR